MALSTVVNGFLLVFIVQMPMVSSRNRAVSRTDLELMNHNATYQVEQLLLKDYDRAVGAMKRLNSETDRCKDEIEGFCEACARERKMSLEKKIIIGVMKIGKKIEKYGKKYGKALAKSVKKVLQNAKKVILKPVKAVKDVINKATKVVEKGLKALSRGVTRLVRRIRIRVRRIRLPRVRIPRIRVRRVLPRIRIRRVRLPRVRLPRVRLPRVRVRFGRRWGKKKKRELREKSVEDYINEEYVKEEQPQQRSVRRISTSCSACERDANILFDGVCRRTLTQLRQLEGVLNRLSAVESSLEETAVIQNVEFDTRRYSMDFQTGMPTFSGVLVTGSLGGQSLSFPSRMSYSFGDDELTKVAKGEAIAREIYARHMWSAYRVLNAINKK